MGGINHILSRVGTLPFYLTILGLPVIIFLRFYKKSKPSEIEIFLLLLFVFTVVLVTTGTRFVLLLTIAFVIFAGYIVGKIVEYLPKEDILKIIVYGTLLVLSFSLVSKAYIFVAPERVSDNWFDAMDWLKEDADEDSLVVTWWDPGHFIVYTTGLKVHADGAQCPDYECVIYDHNVRIQDMGRIFTTSDEDEAISILEKYIQLTPEQCQEVKDSFGKVPEEVCKPISEMYLIASNDLIGKYYWMSFFGDCLKQFGLESTDVCYETQFKWFEENAQGRNFIQLSLYGQDTQGNLIYGFDVITITLTAKDDQLVPIINVPQQGIRNMVIKELVFYQDGEKQRVEYNVTNIVDGMLWVHPDMKSVIFMDSTIRDSLFTKMFFFEGEGLEQFELKYFNSEVRIYKVIFE
jgi:asparagine N-glycosylation enzyme membrane subunit Stt3